MKRRRRNGGRIPRRRQSERSSAMQYSICARPPAPRARFDRDGDAVIEFPPELFEHMAFPFLRHLIDQAIPAPCRDWEEAFGDAVFVRWAYAAPLVRALQCFWPEMHVEAEANPWYGKADELAARLREALTAVDAAERILREALEQGCVVSKKVGGQHVLDDGPFDPQVEEYQIIAPIAGG